MNRLMKRVSVRGIALFSLLALLALPFTSIAGQYAVDVCQSSAGKVTVPIAAATNATTSLIAPVTGAYINICEVVLNSVGGTSQLEYGTGSTCGTGTATLTGTFAAASVLNAGNGGNTVIAVPVISQRVCLVAGASSSATGGWLTYVQGPVPAY